jgi:microcystin-dependent protein
MGQPYIAEIRLFGGNFAPYGWSFCNGALLSISQNDAMFNLIGTTYGGDGQNTFGLPDLQGRVPVHQGQGPGLSNYVLGQKGGAETVTLTVGQLPAHNHAAIGANSTGQASTSPTNSSWGGPNPNADSYGPGPSNATMNAGCIGNTGGNQPHDNVLPFTAVSFIISLQGIYPTP